jgi:hypothetical protein
LLNLVEAEEADYTQIDRYIKFTLPVPYTNQRISPFDLYGNACHLLALYGAYKVNIIIYSIILCIFEVKTLTNRYNRKIAEQ